MVSEITQVLSLCILMIYIKRTERICVQGIETKIHKTWSIKSWYDQIVRDVIRESIFPNGKKNVKLKKKKLSYFFLIASLFVILHVLYFYKSKILHK